MANKNLASSLNFLTDAAHLLAATAPETSAHLMTQRIDLLFTNELPQPDAQREHVCGSCGHIMIPGKGSTVKLSNDKARRRSLQKKPTQSNQATNSSAPAGMAWKQLTCRDCGRYTKIRLPPAPRMMRHGTGFTLKRNMAQAAPSTSSEPAKASANANANSKKRAKNRKQGLQALLQQSQSSSSLGLGLSLTDFLKK